MKKEDHTKDILEVFLIQGMATSSQIRRHIDLSEDQVQYGLRKLTNKVNASFWTTNIRRPWEIEGSGRPEKVFVLTEEGAKELHNNSGLYVSVPSRENTTKNMLHSLALVDIANYCFKKNMECTANKQVNLADSDEYTRPDIIYKTPEGREHFVEFEQTRYKYTLNIKLLTRMKKWQEILTSSKAQQYSNDIFVLFWTEKEDSQTLAAWMSALDDLCKQLTEPPAFNVWYMNFSDFYQNPSFETKHYKKLIPSNNPEEGFLKSERENALKKKKELYLKHLDSDAAEDELIDFCCANIGEITEIHIDNNRQQFFFKQMLYLYDYSINYTPDRTDYARAAIPWFSIAITRRWLELSDLADLRQELINELNSFRSYYLRGLEAAAVALERIVWNTIFRFFNFAKGGGLMFYVNTGDDQNKSKIIYGEGRQVDLIPFTQIKDSFEDICQDQEEKEKLEASINWFVKMLITYQEELGLVRNNRPNKQSKMLCEENPPKREEDD